MKHEHADFHFYLCLNRCMFHVRGLKNKVFRMNGFIKIVKQLAKIILQFILGMVLALVFLFFWGSIGVFSHQTFNKEEWLAPLTNETDSTCYRGGMAMYIKKFLLKNTMSKADVISLLGTPDSEELNQVEYTLGMCSGLGWDYDGLIISFNKNGTFANASIVQH